MIKDFHIVIKGDDAARSRARAGLMEIRGLEDAKLEGNSLRVVYDLREASAAAIVESIEISGLVPVLSWYQRLRLQLRCYREAVLKEDLNNEIGWDSFVREIYVSRYRHRRHGRRDDRPRHWRQYSTPPSE